MASVSKAPNGRRVVQFVGADGKRRSVRLGRCVLLVQYVLCCRSLLLDLLAPLDLLVPLHLLVPSVPYDQLDPPVSVP